MAGFGWASVGHFFATVAQDIVKTEKIAASLEQKVQVAEPLIEGVTSVINPGAVVIERGAFALLGMAAGAIKTAGTAASADGLNLTLDKETVAAIQALIPAFEAFAKQNGYGAAPVAVK